MYNSSVKVNNYQSQNMLKSFIILFIFEISYDIIVKNFKGELI